MVTRFTQQEQLSMDLDWYAVDADGRIGYFTANTGMLPPGIVTNKEAWDRANDYFWSLPVDMAIAVPSDEIDFHVSFASPDKRRVYFNDWLEFAGRGLYSYDSNRSSPLDPDGLRGLPYFLVARPARELLIDEVPAEIASIVRRVQYETGRFSESTVITENEIFKYWRHFSE